MMTTTTMEMSVDHFESIYAEADGNPSRVPWADERPSPSLVNWLNAVAPSLIRCGARVAVVGCGLGDDARELIKRGYDVMAFDWSETAVNWAKRLDPMNASAYHIADLFDLPSRWHHRFDLVVEVNTLQSLLPEQREGALVPLANMLSKHGHLLVICRESDSTADPSDGPPWPLTQDELQGEAEAAGLKLFEPMSIFDDDETPPVTRMRAVFCRS